MEFIDFLGVSRNVPINTADYKHFILLVNTGNNAMNIIYFNSDIVEFIFTGSTLTASFGGETGFKSSKNSSSSFWNNSVSGTSIDIVSHLEVIYCDEALIPYKDLLITKNFSINLAEVVVPDISVTTTTLRPIIEDQENITEDIFSEMFGILPVLIVVLVGFIGIRKSIVWLFSLLKKS